MRNYFFLFSSFSFATHNILLTFVAGSRVRNNLLEPGLLTGGYMTHPLVTINCLLILKKELGLMSPRYPIPNGYHYQSSQGKGRSHASFPMQDAERPSLV